MRMTRFWTCICLLLGGFLLVSTVIRAVQPRQTTGVYQVVYGDLHGGLICCTAYLINEPRRQANRAQVGLLQQDDSLPDSNVSLSGDWKFANVLVSLMGDYRAYFIPTNGDDPMPLPAPVSDGWYAHWSTRNDTLYYFAREGARYESALFRVSPDQPNPVRLSNYVFGVIRTFQEQPLPTTQFSPWALLVISFNLLLIGGLWRLWWQK